MKEASLYTDPKQSFDFEMVYRTEHFQEDDSDADSKHSTNDSKEITVQNASHDMQSTEDTEFVDVSENLFLGKSNRVITYTIPVFIKDFEFEHDPQSDSRFVKFHKSGNVQFLPLLSSTNPPDCFAIDLTSVVGAEKSGLKRGKCVPASSSDPIRHVAYLVLWDNRAESFSSSCVGGYLARLQLALSRECRFVLKEPPSIKRPLNANAPFSLEALIQQALDAIQRIPKSAINWTACQPYHIYEFENEPDYSDDEESGKANTKNQIESSLIVVQNNNWQSEQHSLPNCCLGAHYGLVESVELCVNQHRACMNCAKMYIDRRLEEVCCGVAETEVNWRCPQAGCDAVLTRLAQLQVGSLEQLVCVWKCSDFLHAMKPKIAKHDGKEPQYYANPEINSEAALCVWSGPLRTLPDRSVEIVLPPSPLFMRCWPRLYFASLGKCEIHWPASCQAVQRYYKLRKRFGDFKCVHSSATPNYDGMQPIDLPMPEGARSRFYVNALRIAWRRNVIWKRHFAQKRIWTEFNYVDDIKGREIEEEKFIAWLETLVEMQTILEFLYVEYEFGPIGQEHKSFINIMRRMELSLGQNLGIYPICASIIGAHNRETKQSEKPCRKLPLRVINQRLVAFEKFRPKLRTLRTAI